MINSKKVVVATLVLGTKEKIQHFSSEHKSLQFAINATHWHLKETDIHILRLLVILW